MGNLGGTLILLVLALILLYLAVTDRLSRILDAKDIITGAKTISNNATTGATVSVGTGTPVATQISMSLPSLPSLSMNNAQVPA